MGNVPKGNEPLLPLIPKHERHAAEALEQSQSAYAAEFRMVAEHSRKPIIGNPAAQMVDMVQADVRGEPTQNQRQVVMRAPLQSRLVQGPLTVMSPEGLLELMLHLEQP